MYLSLYIKNVDYINGTYLIDHDTILSYASRNRKKHSQHVAEYISMMCIANFNFKSIYEL